MSERAERPRVMVVDDDALVLASLGALLRKSGFETVEAASGEDALSRLDSAKPALLLCDMSMPGMSGLDVLRAAKARLPQLPVVIVTAYGSIENAVAAMKDGALDYVTKPVDDYVLVQKLRRALEERRLGKENRELRERLDLHRPGGAAGSFVFHHSSMQAIMTKVDAVAATRATVLIRGESGTGKTMLARAIHELSDRQDGPFVEVSCGSLPDPLLESELFGYSKGAFTGAEQDKPGKFEAADGGTMFLDEIGNATPALQVKLLRVLQDRVYERLGSNEEKQIDVRLVLATNVDLERLVAEGKFREDLFYRINVVTLDLPSLRDRIEDVPVLAERFLRRFSEAYGKDLSGFDAEVPGLLLGYDWPGNVRELENVVEHAVVLAKNAEIRAADLPARCRAGASGDGAPEEFGAVRPLKEAMAIPEREYILRVLRMNDGNRQRTAEMLGVNRATLFNKMKKYELFEESLEGGD